MKNNLHLNCAKYLAGGSIAAGVLAGSSAHAAIVIENPDESVSSLTFFSIDPISISSTATTGEFSDDGTKLEAYSAENTGITAGPVSPGDTVGSGTTFVSDTTDVTLGDGTEYYGLELETTPTSGDFYYGYVEETDTSVFDPPITVDLSNTIDTIAYNGTVNGSITIPLPEPSTTSLIAMAAAGAAGLLLYRRTRRGEPIA
jgi:hypothetical protein